MERPGNPNDVFDPMPDESPARLVADTPAADQRAQTMAEARKNLLAGVLWCAGGLAFSFITYYFTSAGGRYVVATGAIIWGAVQAVKGLAVMLKTYYREGRFSAFWRTAAIAVCSLAALVYLGQLSVGMLGGEDLQLIETEQRYACDSLGLRFRVPAGYTALETSGEPETETTYAHYNISTYNQDIGINIEGVIGFLDPQEVESASALAEYCTNRDSVYYDAGIIAPTQQVEIGGRQMLNSEGRTKENPGVVYSVFDLVHGNTLVTVSFCYEEKSYGKPHTRQRIEKLLSGIELY